MPATINYPHIEQPPGEPARLIRLPRIRVSQIILPYLMHGWSPEELERQYPHLTMAEVHAAMGFYYDNTEEISREMEADLNGDERLRAQAAATPFQLRLRAKET